MNWAEIGNMAAGVAIGGLLTAGVSWIRLSTPIKTLGTKINGVKENFEKCQSLHEDCPTNLIAQLRQSVAESNQGTEILLRDIVKRLGAIEQVLMTWKK